MANNTIRSEEDIKAIVAKEWFPSFDCTHHYGRVDFAAVSPADPIGLNEDQSLYWAESKKGTSEDIFDSMVQLILTIGKERPQDSILPPQYIGAFDVEKISFMPYHCILEVLAQNDFNWNVAPSNHETKEFKQLSELVRDSYNNNVVVFNFQSEAKELKRFITQNFKVGKSGTTQISITKNNFTNIYQQWVDQVKPSIDIDWQDVKKDSIIDADFFLADIMSKDNTTLRDKLNVLLRNDTYRIVTAVNRRKRRLFEEVPFKDGQKSHNIFWNKFKRPPRREYWEFMITRRDLLVPQDIREIKGAYFTPKQWVQLSQQYLADALGENWQDEYYIWDCAAGTGNLLAGLTNKYNIYASTIDQQDIDVMHDRIQAMNAASRDGHSGSNLLEQHIFKFDFLNDPFDVEHLPQSLLDIINDPDRRKKLVVYINPPFKEVSSKRERDGKKGAKGVNQSKTHEKYKSILGGAGRDIYPQFFIRIFNELNGCHLAAFSPLKHLTGSSSVNFRKFFNPFTRKLFIAPSYTFDNVGGSFPIGFFVYDTSAAHNSQYVVADIYDSKSNPIGLKEFYFLKKTDYINAWINNFRNLSFETDAIGFMDGVNGNDVQHNNTVYIKRHKREVANPRGFWVGRKNLIACSVYSSVRHVIEDGWINDRDQFLVPSCEWISDDAFLSDCLIYTIWHDCLALSAHGGPNHWIPFTAQQMNTRERLDSTFMSDFLAGRLQPISKEGEQQDMFDESAEHNLPDGTKPIVLTEAAQLVMDAGLQLYRYYHSQNDSNPNASFYDIKGYFQGFDSKGRMNSSSTDERYTSLLSKLRAAHKQLAEQIIPKVYQYRFLK